MRSESPHTDPPMSWAPGTSIVYQEVWGEQLLVARPVTVVEDHDGLLALYTHPRVRYRSAAMGTERYQKTLEERIAVMISDDCRVYEERVGADSHVLVLAPEGQWNALSLFWRADWEHVCGCSPTALGSGRIGTSSKGSALTGSSHRR